MKKYFVLIAVVCGILFSCKPEPQIPSVSTHPVTEVTSESALCSGMITDSGNDEISSKGFCWSTSQNPTLNDNVTTELSRNEPNMEHFTATIRNLKDSTTYYVRAFATNSVGTAYGSEQTFTTLKADDNGGDDNGGDDNGGDDNGGDDDGGDDNGEIDVVAPTVVTLSASCISFNTASIGAEVTADGGAEVTTRGFYWNEKSVEYEGELPLNDNKVEAGSGVGPFNYQLTGLKEGTEYRVMAFATNDAGTSYGEIVYFVTEKNNIEIVLPTVTKVTVSDITYQSVVCSAEVVSDGGADVTEYGLFWQKCNAGIDNNETIEPNYVKVGEGIGAFTHKITGLLESTGYYVGVYAINSAGTVHGETVSFTTEANDEVIEYEYVDLGLPSGVKWAMHNVGTTYPEGHGDYFAWGEIEPKATYESGNCSSYNQDLGDISGNHLYDAAAAKWGNGWRMPTLEEMYELTQECTWTWVEDNGIVGYKVTSKTNGNHIFLPAAGFRVNDQLIDEDFFGYYWMSTPYEEEGAEPTLNKACFLDMCSYQFYCNWSLRRNGMTIRPVKD